MDINDNQQVNTFLKGMNTDVSDALIDNSQYRYAENLRLDTSVDSNSGELRIIEGGSLFTKIEQETNKPVLLNSIKIRDLNVFVIKETTTGKWSIFVVQDDSPQQMWCPIKANAQSISDNISLVGRYEDSEHVYLYIADGVHELRQINIADHQTKNEDYIESSLKSRMPKISAKISNINGYLKAGKVQYTYYFYKKHGAQTDLAPMSNIVSIISYDTFDGPSRKNTVGFPDNKNSNIAVDVTIDKTTSPAIHSFDKLRIIRVQYVQNGQEPTVSIIYDDAIPEDTFTYTDTGKYITISSTSEFYSANNLAIIPKVIESKDGYLFAGNINYPFEVNDSSFDDASYSNPTGNQSSSAINWEITYSNWYPLTQPIVNDGVIQQVPSLRRGETYRFGVVLYNKQGKRSSVKHIADIEIPRNVSIFEKRGNVFYGRSVGVRFTMKNVDPNKISAWEIVRCVRTMTNTKTISTGVFGLTLNVNKNDIDNGSTYSTNFNSGFLTLRNIIGRNYDNIGSVLFDEKYMLNVESDPNLGFFASPEAVYSPTDITNAANNYSTKIIPQYWLQANSNYINLGTVVQPIVVHDPYMEPEGQDCHQFILWNTDSNLDISMNIWSQHPSSPGYWRNWGRYSKTISGEEIRTTFNLIRPVTYQENSISASYDIDKIKYTQSPQPSSLMDQEGNYMFQDDVEPISTKDFMKWSMFGAAYLIKGYNQINDVTTIFKKDSFGNWASDERAITLSGMTGSGMLVKPKTPISKLTQSGSTYPIVIADIQKTFEDYGDPEQSVYMSYGDYFYNDGVSPRTVSENVFDGDCYLREFEYNALNTFYEPNHMSGIPLSSIVYQIPLETEIDLFASMGYTFRNAISENKENFYDIQDYACVCGDWEQNKDFYLYNTAYSSNPSLSTQSAEDESDYASEAGMYDVRVHASQLKTNNELIDQWLRFKAANYIDVDSRFGEITHMRLFKNNIVCWQKDATSVLSINERTVINDLDENSIVLGTGGLLQRFDYITTLYGMRPNHFAETQSNHSLYWWDFDRRELIQYSGGYDVVPLIRAKNVTNYVQQNITDLNNKPKLGFDIKYGEVLSNITSNTLVYNEQLGAFTSVYKIAFSGALPYNNTIRLVNGADFYNWNSGNGQSTFAGQQLVPLLRYVVNKNNTMVKVFDITTFGGRFYGGDTEQLNNLSFDFRTPLKQRGRVLGENLITNREYDFRLNIPRNANSSYGDRMRGKTMQCELKSSSNSSDFSLQYIITKYRMSWS